MKRVRARERDPLDEVRVVALRGEPEELDVEVVPAGDELDRDRSGPDLDAVDVERRARRRSGHDQRRARSRAKVRRDLCV